MPSEEQKARARQRAAADKEAREKLERAQEKEEKLRAEEEERALKAQLAATAAKEAAARAAAAAEAAEASTERSLAARDFNLSLAKRARLGGEQRPCIGIASQIVTRTRPQDGAEYDDVSGCRLVPFDVSAMAQYLGFPLEQWPGLAAVAKMALLERPPAPWVEVDPQAQAKLPGWVATARGAAEAASGAYGTQLVYWQAETGCVATQHPRDAWYRYLIRHLLETNECPFLTAIMQFNVNDTPETGADDRLEASFFYDFESCRTLPLTDVLAGADATTLSTTDGIVKADTVITSGICGVVAAFPACFCFGSGYAPRTRGGTAPSLRHSAIDTGHRLCGSAVFWCGGSGKEDH